MTTATKRATLDAPSTLADRYIPLHAHLVSPLHQGTFPDLVDASRISKHKNFLYINTLSVFTGSGFAEVPVVSGNSIRGRLRRHAAAAALDALRSLGCTALPSLGDIRDQRRNLSSPDRFLLQLLLAGGSLSAKSDKGPSVAADPANPNSNDPQATTDTPSSSEDAEPDAPQDNVTTFQQNGHRAERREHPDGTAITTEFLDNGDKVVTTDVPIVARGVSRTALEQALPALELFGYADGDNHLTPGRVSVSFLYPVLKETGLLLADWTPIKSLPVLREPAAVGSWAQLTQSGYPRSARVHSDSGQQYFDQGTWAPVSKQEGGTTAQMFFHLEYVPPPMDFVGALVLDPGVSDALRGLVYLALARLEDEGYLGGQRAAGYGQVLWPHSVRERPDYAAAVDAFAAAMAQVAPNAGEILREVVEMVPGKPRTIKAPTQGRR